MIDLLCSYLCIFFLNSLKHPAPSPESPESDAYKRSWVYGESDSDFEQALIQVSLKIRSNQSNQHKRALPARSYLGHLLQWLRSRCQPCQRYPSLSKSQDQVCYGCLMQNKDHCGCCSEIVKGHDYIVCTPWCGTRHGRRVTCDNFFPTRTSSRQNIATGETS